MTDPIRIANCSGFFGDRPSGALEMVDGGPIDVLTGDWLAELTMLILSRIRAKRPGQGYARTFVGQMEQVMGTCLDSGIKVVSNAGGLDPDGCAEAVKDVADKLGLSPTIAYVNGDNLLGRIAELAEVGALQPFPGADGVSGDLGDLSDYLSANAYLGCFGIVDALTATGSEAEEYSAALKTFSGGLQNADDIDQIRGLVVDIIEETDSMDARSKELNNRVNASANEINELRKALDDSRRDALTDGLTGVANRKCFDQEIYAAAQQTGESGQPLSLILADLDHFKTFNDTYGHQLGDQVLRLVGKALYDSVKGKDTAARYGGEEFAIILPDTTSGGATAVADNIRKTVASKRLKKKGSDEALGAVTMSLGVTSYHCGEDISDFIERADQALYMAKKLGRNRVICEDKQQKIAAV